MKDGDNNDDFLDFEDDVVTEVTDEFIDLDSGKEEDKSDEFIDLDFGEEKGKVKDDEFLDLDFGTEVKSKVNTNNEDILELSGLDDFDLLDSLGNFGDDIIDEDEEKIIHPFLSFQEIKNLQVYNIFKSFNSLKILDKNCIQSLISINQMSESRREYCLSTLRDLISSESILVYNLIDKVVEMGTVNNIDKYVDEILNFSTNVYTEDASKYSIAPVMGTRLITNYAGSSDTADRARQLEKRLREKIRIAITTYLTSNRASSDGLSDLTDLLCNTKGVATDLGALCVKIAKSIMEIDSDNNIVRLSIYQKVIGIDSEGNLALREKRFRDPGFMKSTLKTNKFSLEMFGDWVSRFPLDVLDVLLYEGLYSYTDSSNKQFSLTVSDLFKYEDYSSAKAIIHEALRVSFFEKDSVELSSDKLETLSNKRIKELYNVIPSMSTEDIDAAKYLYGLSNPEEYLDNVYKYGGYDSVKSTYICGRCGTSTKINGPLASIARVGSSSRNSNNQLLFHRISKCRDCGIINVIPESTLVKMIDQISLNNVSSSRLLPCNNNIIVTTPIPEDDIEDNFDLEFVDDTKDDNLTELAVSSEFTEEKDNIDDYINSCMKYYTMMKSYTHKLKIDNSILDERMSINSKDILPKTKDPNNIVKNRLFAELACKATNSNYHILKSKAIATLIDSFESSGVLDCLDNIFDMNIRAMNHLSGEEINIFRDYATQIDYSGLKDRLISSVPYLGMMKIKEIALTEYTLAIYDTSNIKDELDTVTDFMIITTLLTRLSDIYKYYVTSNKRLFNLNIFEDIEEKLETVKLSNSSSYDTSSFLRLYSACLSKHLNHISTIIDLQYAINNKSIVSIVELGNTLQTQFSSFEKELNDLITGFITDKQLDKTITESFVYTMIPLYKTIVDNTFKFIDDIKDFNIDFFSLDSVKPLVTDTVYSDLLKLKEHVKSGKAINEDTFEGRKLSDEDIKTVKKFLTDTENFTKAFTGFTSIDSNDIIEVLTNYNECKEMEPVAEYEIYNNYRISVIFEVNGLASVADDVNWFGDYLVANMASYEIIRNLVSNNSTIESLVTSQKYVGKKNYEMYILNLFENTDVLREYTNTNDFESITCNNKFINRILSNTLFPDDVLEVLEKYQNEDFEYLFETLNEVSEVLRMHEISVPIGDNDDYFYLNKLLED